MADLMEFKALKNENR